MSSSFDSLYKRLTSSLEHGGAGHAHEARLDPGRHISPVVAQELNHLFTIIHGCTEQLLVTHKARRKIIAEASNGAASAGRAAKPPAAKVTPSEEIRQLSREQPVA